MPSYAGPTANRSGDVAGTLRLLGYLALATMLVVLDHRGGWLNRARQQAEGLMQPVRALAGLPGRVVETVSTEAGTMSQLRDENRRLRNALLVTRARMARLATVNADNARLRRFLAAAEQGRLDVQLAPVLDVDLDPSRQRLVLAAGGGAGVRVGQTVIDAGGVVGQIIEVGPLQSTVLLLTDPDHAIPVAVARNGVRLVAYGTGRADRLALASVPLSSDVKVGDVLVTSGLGGRYAAGFPVGTIAALRPDESRAFLLGDVRPAAELDRGRDVLLLRTMPVRPVIGPIASSPAMAGEGGAGVPSAAAASGTPAGSSVGGPTLPSEKRRTTSADARSMPSGSTPSPAATSAATTAGTPARSGAHAQPLPSPPPPSQGRGQNPDSSSPSQPAQGGERSPDRSHPSQSAQGREQNEERR